MKLPALCLIVYALLSGCGKPKASAQPEPVVRVPVKTAPAFVRHVQAAFDETGTFVADESSNIAPAVAGLVTRTPVNVGAFVKEGQIVCELDHRDAQLHLRQVRAQLTEATAAVRQAQVRVGLGAGKFEETKVPEVAAAQANYESAKALARQAAADAVRYANLVKSGDVSQSAFEKARTQQETAEAQANAGRQQYEAALNATRQSVQAISSSEASLDAVRAQVAQAEKGLADTYIRAPFAGYISARPVAAGEYVALSNTIATLVRIGTVKLQLQTPEQRAAKAKVGMSVLARVSAYADRDFSGQVSALNPAIDPNSRVFILEAKFSNGDGALRPGMFATARVLLPGGEDAVYVPRQAIVRDKTTDSNLVYIVDHGHVRARVVLTAAEDGDSVRIASGLTGNEKVVTSNQAQLFDGAEVTL